MREALSGLKERRGRAMALILESDWGDVVLALETHLIGR